MGLSFWHLIVVVILVVLLFGRGKVSDLMGDVAKGIKGFRKTMAEDDRPSPPPPPAAGPARELPPSGVDAPGQGSDERTRT